MTTGIERIAAERQRQIDAEGWTPEHDDEHDDSELAQAAYCYVWAARQALLSPLERQSLALPIVTSRDRGSSIWPTPAWPWHPGWWKPTDDSIRNLEKAGALIAAEIDRLQRVQP